MRPAFRPEILLCFFFNDTPTTEIYTLSLHDALPIYPGRTIAVQLQSERRIEASQVVVAAGAWVSSIAGLPHALPVEPARGQMLSLPRVPVHHVVMGPRGYLVPRRDEVLIGSTMERVGFDACTTDEGATLLCEIAGELVP